MKIIRMLVGVFAAAAYCTAKAQFAFDVQEPPFRVSIPRLPVMHMADHPFKSTQPHLRLLGSKEPYSVSILTPTADAGMRPVDCASSTVNSLVRRPGVPSQDRIYKAKLDSNTYIAMYVTPMSGFVQLHAHLLSAAGGTHCVEVHASMVSKSKEDVEPWFKSFADARIEPQ